MHPRYIPTVEQFRPYRHHPAPADPSQRVSGRSLRDWITGGGSDRRPARGRLRPPVEFRVVSP
jgi:hypothetical protein